MPYAIASRFERGERGAIFTVCGIWPFVVFVKSSQRVLRLPLQKNGANLVLLDCAKDTLGTSNIATTRSHLPLHKPRIKFIDLASALSCVDQSPLGVLARLRGACLNRNPPQSAQRVVTGFFLTDPLSFLHPQ